jgi:hypothetical protein
MEFASKYPQIIRPLLHPNHIGGGLNYIAVYAYTRGELLAHLDGDDLMQQGRLQKQFDFLESRPECAFVVHRVNVISEDGSRLLGVMPRSRQPEVSTVQDLIGSYLFFVHSSKMVRRDVHFHFPRNESTADAIDFTIAVESATRGKIGFISEVLGTYRRGSIASLSGPKGGAKLHAIIASTLEGYDRALELNVDPVTVSQGRARYLFGAAMHCASLGDMDGMMRYMSASASCPHRRGLMSALAPLLASSPAIAGMIVGFGLWARSAKHRLLNLMRSS